MDLDIYNELKELTFFHSASELETGCITTIRLTASKQSLISWVTKTAIPMYVKWNR